MKTRVKNRLKEMVAIPGVTGNEEKIVAYMKEELEKYADEVNVDKMGNIWASKKGKSEGPRMLVIAHSDQIGFCVKNILDDGFILFDKVGTPSNKATIGREVLINGDIPGVIGIKSAHLESAEEAVTVTSHRDLYIDVAASSREEVEEMGIKIGDTIEFRSDFLEMTNPDYVCTKSIDNRIGCALLIELMIEMQDMEFDGEIIVAASVQEETGMKGGFVLGNRLNPDYAIVVDTIPSGDTPDINTEKDLPVRLTNGPVLVLGDGLASAILFVYSNKRVVELIDKSAENAGVNLQRITLVGEGYATDAARLSFAGDGIPIGTLAVPRRYTHSPIELFNVNDAVDHLKVLKGLVELNGEANFDFI